MLAAEKLELPSSALPRVCDNDDDDNKGFSNVLATLSQMFSDLGGCSTPDIFVFFPSSFFVLSGPKFISNLDSIALLIMQSPSFPEDRDSAGVASLFCS